MAKGSKYIQVGEVGKKKWVLNPDRKRVDDIEDVGYGMPTESIVPMPTEPVVPMPEGYEEKHGGPRAGEKGAFMFDSAEDAENVLLALGMVPGVDIPANLLLSGLYMTQGEWTDAVIAAGFALPIANRAVGGAVHVVTKYGIDKAQRMYGGAVQRGQRFLDDLNIRWADVEAEHAAQQAKNQALLESRQVGHLGEEMAEAYRKEVAPELVAHRSKGADVRSAHESIPEYPYNSAQLAKNVLKENEAAHTVMGHMKNFGEMSEDRLDKLFTMGKYSIYNIDNFSSNEKFLEMAKKYVTRSKQRSIGVFEEHIVDEFEYLLEAGIPKLINNRRAYLLGDMLSNGQFRDKFGRAVVPKMKVGTKHIEGSTRLWEGKGTSGNLSNVLFDDNWGIKYKQFLEHGYYGSGKIVDDVVDDMLLFE